MAFHSKREIVVSFVKIRTSYPFDVNLKTVESVLLGSFDVLSVDSNALLLEEVLHAWLGNDTVIGSTVCLETTNHVLLGVVGAFDLSFWELTHTLN